MTTVVTTGTDNTLTQQAKASQWTIFHTLSIPFFPITIAATGLLMPVSWRFLAWIVIVVLLTLFTTIVGHGITGSWRGILIDERNKISLSRFQTAIWGLLILSAFVAAALTNLPIDIASRPINALSISFPVELLALLGISTTSLVGTPLILNNKKRGEVDNNENRGEAHWSDMFKGDDVCNADYLDLGKVQMFYFTLILVLVYAVALAFTFMTVDPKHVTITAFPALSATMVTLLGISHAGYLLYKAVPRNENSTK